MAFKTMRLQLRFLLPLMLGAKDVAFPRLNLLSWYVFIVGGGMFMLTMINGGIDTGWTFYPPYSSIYSNTQVTLAGVSIFITGFSSILTGLNFMVTIHTMRAPGMTWFRLPLFIWAHYATSLIMLLGTLLSMLLASQMNDKPISVRTKGPLFIVYPYDTSSELPPYETNGVVTPVSGNSRKTPPRITIA